MTAQERWMPPARLAEAARSSLYLSRLEQQPIATVRERRRGVREIARRLDRTASKVSRELRRNLRPHNRDRYDRTRRMPGACVLAGHRGEVVAREGSVQLEAGCPPGLPDGVLEVRRPGVAAVVVGVDPHKLSATIDVVDEREKVLGGGRFPSLRTYIGSETRHQERRRKRPAKVGNPVPKRTAPPKRDRP